MAGVLTVASTLAQNAPALTTRGNEVVTMSVLRDLNLLTAALTVHPASLTVTAGQVVVSVGISGTIPPNHLIQLHFLNSSTGVLTKNVDFDPSEANTVSNTGIRIWTRTISTIDISGTFLVGSTVFSEVSPYPEAPDVENASAGVTEQFGHRIVGQFTVIAPVVESNTSISWVTPFAANSYWKTPINQSTAFYADPATDIATQQIRAQPNKVFCNVGRFINWIWLASNTDPFITINVSAQYITSSQPFRAGTVTLRCPTNAFPDPGYNGGTQPVGQQWRLQEGVQNDKHFMVVSPDRTFVDEFWYTHNTVPTTLPPTGEYRAVAWVRVPLTSGDGLNIQGTYSQLQGKGYDNSDWAGSTLGWSATKAYGGTQIGGLIRAGDLTGSEATMPEHVWTAALPSSILRFNAARTENGFNYIYPPASRPDTAGGSGGAQKIPHGMRFALLPSFDVASLSTVAGRKFAYAAKKYGIMIVDVANGGGFACNGDYQLGSADINAFQAAAADRTIIGNNLVYCRVADEPYQYN